MKQRKRKGKKRINKKRLLIVIVVIACLIFGVSRIVVSLKNMITPKNQVEQQTKTNDEIQAEKERVINVYVDPEKGGINQGLSTPDGSLKEKDINLDIAKRVKANLEKHNDVKVFMTREYDENKSIDDRVSSAKDNNADILVSIRLNAQANSDEAEGLDTYYSDLDTKKKLVRKDESKDKDSKEEIVSSIRNKENADSDIENPLKSSKEGKNIKEEKVKRDNLSEALAKSVQSTTLSFIDMKDRGVVKKNFDVLTYTKMPSIIVQCGFISNKKDGEKLQEDKYRQDISEGISEGILNFIDSNRNKIIADRVNFR